MKKHNALKVPSDSSKSKYTGKLTKIFMFETAVVTKLRGPQPKPNSQL